MAVADPDLQIRGGGGGGGDLDPEIREGPSLKKKNSALGASVSSKNKRGLASQAPPQGPPLHGSI